MKLGVGSLLVLALAASCSGTPSDDAVAGGQPLCDGSAGARLTYLVGGGQVDEAYAFHGVYGHAAFVIDGQCHYWVAESPLRGLRTGTLNAEMATIIARQLHWASLATLSAHRDVQSCPDAGESLIGDGTHVINCSCGCDDQLPAATKEAFARVDAFYRSLMAMGGAYDGPVRAVTLRQDAPGLSAARILDWSLAISPMEFLLEGPSIQRDSGKLIEAAGDRTELRKLRTMALPLETGAGFYARTSDGSTFHVYARDEAPAHVVAGLAVH
jgi:hypothetical protein